jgi:hypothetical protein
MQISAGTTSQLVPTGAVAEVNMSWAHDAITDRCAVTIAAWFQAPGFPGRVFADLAITGKVDHEALMEAVLILRPTLQDIESHKALDCLALWAFLKAVIYPQS